MKKLFAVLAMATIATSAFGQATLPSAKRGLRDAVVADKKTTRIDILQVMECLDPVDDKGGPSLTVVPGVSRSNWCFRGTDIDTTLPACRFVGGVLCLDPGPNSNFDNWPLRCNRDTENIVIQGAKLRKIEPKVPKCPDIYPGIDWVQTGNAGIRTFWALKYTPCLTEFRVQIEYACVSKAFPHRIVGLNKEDTFTYRVVVRPDTLRYVLEALHCQPLGACEVPCITDEGLFGRLLVQADAIAAAAAAATGGSNAAYLTLNDAFDSFEATLVKHTLFTSAVWQYVTEPVDPKDPKGPVMNVGIIPCAIFGGIVPGNKTIDKFGFGIVDTYEHPCACKLIADIVCLKNELIGNDP